MAYTVSSSTDLLQFKVYTLPQAAYDLLAANGTINGHVLDENALYLTINPNKHYLTVEENFPTTDSTYNIGTGALRWKALYLSPGTGVADLDYGLNIGDTHIGAHQTEKTLGLYSIGENIYIGPGDGSNYQNASYLFTTQTFRPTVDATADAGSDLGSSSKKWKNLYSLGGSEIYAVNNAGQAYIGWIKFYEFTLSDNNYFGNGQYRVSLTRDYNSPSPEAYTFLFSIAWSTATITQINGNAANQIIDQVRIVKDATNHKAWFEYHVNESFTTYINTVRTTVKALTSNSQLGTAINIVQTEADSDLTIITSMPIHSDGIITSGGLNVGKSAVFGGSITPRPTDYYNLGSATYKWKNLFLSGIIQKTARHFLYLGSQERSQWYKITFPYSTYSTGSSAAWFMNSFDICVGGGYNSNPSGVLHTTFYWTRAANDGAWSVGQVGANAQGMLIYNVELYYSISEPGVLYVHAASNNYNGISIQNLYIDDTAPSLDWTTTTIQTCSAITVANYTKIPQASLGTQNNNANFYTSTIAPYAANFWLGGPSAANTWYAGYFVQTAMRHIDAATNENVTDHNLYIGYGARTYTSNIYFYTSTGSTDTVSGRTQWFDINSNGAYARTRFGVNGQSTSYVFYCNGTSYFNGAAYINNKLTVNAGTNAPPVQINSSAGSWSYIRLHNGSNFWDIATINAANGTAAANSLGFRYNGAAPSASAGVYITPSQVLYGAAWNDYAEYRPTDINEPGRCVKETLSGTMTLTTKRLEKGCEIISDTFGFAIGKTQICQTPIAATGRVLAYTDKPRETFELGMPVCSGPNGTVSQMTEEEARMYPWCIIGTVSEIPTYEEWGEEKVKTNGRIWIRIR